MFSRSGNPLTLKCPARRRGRTPWFILALTLVALLAAGAFGSPAQAARGAGILSTLKVPFVANQGQSNPEVAFYASALTGKLYVLRDGRLSYQFRSRNGEPVVFSETVGRPSQAPAGLDQAEARINILVGRDRSQWRPNLPTFNRVSLGQVAPGVRVELHSRAGNVEKYFHFAPGSSPDNFQVHVEGAREVSVLPSGQLRIKTDQGAVSFSAPKAFQVKDGDRTPVQVGYLVQGMSYRFQLGEYDPSREVVVDPVVDWATYLGGSGDSEAEDNAYAVTVDPYGYIYVAGRTQNSDFVASPARPFSYGSDAFLVKIRPDGSSLVFATLVGGGTLAVPTDDWANGVAVDEKGVALITGGTKSQYTFPQVNPLQSWGGGEQDAFIVRFNATGTDLVFSTFVGGDGVDEGNAIAVDAEKNFYVVGATQSTNFPYTTGDPPAGSTDAFVMKVSSVGTQFWSRLMGGPNADFAYGVAVDDDGNTYLVGTTSGGFPTSHAFQSILGGDVNSIEDDAFVAKLNPDVSQVIYATYLGGYYSEDGRGIAVKDGAAYVVGSTTSTDFPVTGDALQSTHGDALQGDFGNDFFIAKITESGGNAVLSFSTFLGGTSDDWAFGMALDADGYIYVVGDTGMVFPTVNPFQSSGYGGGTTDAVVAMITLNPTPAVVHASFLGGTDWDSARAVTITPESKICVVGETKSTNFPTVNPFQTDYGGGKRDAFIAVIDSEQASPPPPPPPPLTPLPFLAPLIGRTQ